MYKYTLILEYDKGARPWKQFTHIHKMMCNIRAYLEARYYVSSEMYHINEDNSCIDMIITSTYELSHKVLQGLKETHLASNYDVALIRIEKGAKQK